jgi:mannose-6-phosphate isomerase-like protein (cupin superfamily)
VAGFTVVNLMDVEDQAPNFGYAPNIQARFAGGDLGLENSGISHQRYAPNFRQPFGHSHKQQEELYVIAAGSGRLKLDDEIVDVKQWDAVRIPPEVVRCVEAGPEGIEVLCFGAPSTGDSAMDDVVPAPNWWTD